MDNLEGPKIPEKPTCGSDCEGGDDHHATSIADETTLDQLQSRVSTTKHPS